MSPSVYVIKRDGARGPSYHVRYRLGGRYSNAIHAGAFRTIREAKMRRDLIAGEIAAGRDPRHALHQITNPPQVLTIADGFDRVLERPGISLSRQKIIRQARAKFTPLIGDIPVETITRQQCQDAINKLSHELSPASIKSYAGALKQAIDVGERYPNPARQVRLPSVVRDEHAPPPSAHVVAMLDRLPDHHRKPVVWMEQTAMRVGEVKAMDWADMDIASSRVLVRSQTAKTRKPRWVQVPEWLMDLVASGVAPEDRTGRVFRVNDEQLRKAMAAACRHAGIPVYSPHDLRHRRISLWHGQGVPAAELAHRAGHSRPSMSLDEYSWVMPLDEVPAERLFEAAR